MIEKASVEGDVPQVATYERKHQSVAWLCASMDDQDKFVVSMFWCVVCRKYETRMCGLKNFSRA